MSGLFGYAKDKFKISPYKDVSFKERPYDKNNRFSVYIPE